MEILIGLLVVVIVGELLRLRRRKNHEENKKPFDGAVLGEENKLVDDIGGVEGTPVGNPIGRADRRMDS